MLCDFAKRESRRGPSQSGARCNRLLRLRLIQLVVTCWCALVIFRLHDLQLSSDVYWRTAAKKQHVGSVELVSERGPIYDRFGRLLSVSVPAVSVWARPGMVADKLEASKRLAKVLDRSQAEIFNLLSAESPFVWLQRQAPKPLAERIDELAEAGVGYFLESRRYYPYQQASSRLLGMVGTDGHGLSGIEERYESHLRGQNIQTLVARDGFGKSILQNEELAAPDGGNGKPLSLTLDADLQLIVDVELERGWHDAKAENAMAVMVDARNGEVLAMSQMPPLNLNADEVKERAQLSNLVIESVFEPGSILKPIVMAGALENHVVSSSDTIDCERGSFRFAKHTIRDVHPQGMLSAEGVIVHSSNIGMSKIGSRLGSERLHNVLENFGFGTSTELGLPGESEGILRETSNWAAIDVATHSFGQGIAVTPLQMVRAVSAIVNDGRLPHLSLVRTGVRREPGQILSPDTARTVRHMMMSVVDHEGGTGSRARIPGIEIGGKTGTAQRARDDGRGYEEGSYVASFVGFADATEIHIDEKLVLLVVMDRPHAKSIYGGVVSAPVFQRIMRQSLNVLRKRHALDEEFSIPEEHLSPYQKNPLLRPASLKTW